MATILALGAYLKNAACLRRADASVQWSALHGDLGTPTACAALEASAEALLHSAGGRVDALAHDLHPDFHSTRVAGALAARLGVPAFGVQHHHAHVAVVAAERALAGPVIGLALDGVGLGRDGTAWGGELLRVQGAGCERLAHLWPLALPGGDRAAREPWRMAAAALHALGRGDEIAPRLGPAAGEAPARGVAQMLARGLHCPPTTSAGRWFDAAAGILGLGLRQAQEAEAAQALEQAATRWLQGHELPAYDALVPRDAGARIDLRPLFARLAELGAAQQAGEGAALFHAVLAEALARAAGGAAAAAGVGQVVLAGGCFFNRLLAQRLRTLLERRGLEVLLPQSVNCGDAGLALGQAWVAERRLAEAPAPIEEGAACV
ncbi:MAG: hypothetical protein AMXMBFR66_13300 [Pseudomonadota bacterium]